MKNKNENENENEDGNEDENVNENEDGNGNENENENEDGNGNENENENEDEDGNDNEKNMTISKYILTALLLTISIASQAQQYHKTDTLDEEDYISRRDTIKMSRRNIALTSNDKYYGTDYVIDDRFLVANEQFSRGLLDNLYVSGGVGFDFLQPRTEGFSSLQLTQLNLAVGKQLTPVHSLRLSLGAAMSYLQDEEFYFFRGTTKLDYLFDLSSHFNGYKAARPLSVSLLTGVGANFLRKDESWKMRIVPDLHAGLQFRIYTGPRCYLNIEPYASISTDQLDYAKTPNWRKYDVSYGVNLNMQYYLFDPLSSQSKLRLLNARSNNDHMVDKQTLSTWRTPWFIEAASGAIFNKVEGLGWKVGNATGIAVGRWLSPVLGFRLGAVTRSAMSMQLDGATSLSGSVEKYYSHYNCGRIDFLINPLGYRKNFSWDDQFGGYLLVGTEIGSAQYHDNTGERRAYFAQAITAGVHLWTKLTNDLQFFIEPRYSHDTYTRTSHGDGRRFSDNMPSINLGLTMMIRSQKFHDLDEFDEVQNFIHNKIRGFRFGVNGGIAVLHPRNADYGGNANWNASADLEYRFSHLHSVRASALFMNAKRNYPAHNEQGLELVETNSIIGSLDYEVSVTNLLSGILKNRWCELEAFAGPSVEYILSRKGADGYYNNKGPMFGINAGLKLSKHIWNGISVVATPTLYLINGTTPKSLNTVSIMGYHYYQTFSLGIQYKIGSLHRNPAKVQAAKQRADQRWNMRQQEKLFKQQRKNEQRKQLTIDN